MAPWDFYCAFCGCPFRATRFLLQGSHDIDKDEALVAWETQNIYMPGVITKAETAWTEYLQCLGNILDSRCLPGTHDPPGDVALSVIGSAQDYGEVCLESFCSHKALPGLIVGRASTYDVRDRESLIPFHLKCFELFQQVLVFKTGHQFKTRLLLDGSWEQVTPCRNLDKSLLYGLLWELIGKTGQCLQISYGQPEPSLDYMWVAEPDMELHVADPNQKNDLIRGIIHNAWLRINHHASNEIRNSTQATEQHDPFVQLPFEILLIITSALNASSVMSLLHASPYAHRIFDGNELFWTRQFQQHMPWFYEMRDYLSESLGPANTGTRDLVSSLDTNPSHRGSLRRFFAWANHITTPRVGMTGPFMGVGNRRRIWGVCAHLVDLYLARIDLFLAHSLSVHTLKEEEVHIRSHAVCMDMSLVRFPLPDTLYTVKSFWMRSKSEAHALKRGYTLNIFWEHQTLSGLGVVLEMDGYSQLRLLGSDDYQDGISKQSMRVASGDWVTGLILYYPWLNGSRTSWCPIAGWKTEFPVDTYVSGLSVICHSGHKADFGTVAMRHIRRPLLATKDMEIVGLMGQLGEEVYGHRIFRFGLLQMPRHLVQDTSHVNMEAFTDDVPRPTWAGSTAWLNDCTEIFSPESPTAGAWSSSEIPVWVVPDLHVQQPQMSRISDHIPNEIVEHEPLIWAKDIEEAHNLRWVTGLILEGNDVRKTENDVVFEQCIRGICAVKAEFAPESGMAIRATGLRVIGDGHDWPEDRCACLEVDGAGGEMITAVSVAQNGYPRAIKLITNRGKEICWGEENQPKEVWQTFVAPEGNMFIGIVLSFVTPICWNSDTKVFDSAIQSSVVVLSLPMK